MNCTFNLKQWNRFCFIVEHVFSLFYTLFGNSSVKILSAQWLARGQGYTFSPLWSFELAKLTVTNQIVLMECDGQMVCLNDLPTFAFWGPFFVVIMCFASLCETPWRALAIASGSLELVKQYLIGLLECHGWRIHSIIFRDLASPSWTLSKTLCLLDTRDNSQGFFYFFLAKVPSGKSNEGSLWS